MTDSQPHFDWPRVREAPEIRRRLRGIRPEAEIIYTGHGNWMLGEYNPTWARYLHGVALYQEMLNRKAMLGVEDANLAQQRSRYQDAELLIRGFTWIRDYFGDPDGRIVEDYRRMCWKEDRGELDKEYMMMVTNSSDEGQLQRKMEWYQKQGRPFLRDAAHYAYRRPRSVNIRNARAKSRTGGIQVI